MPELVQLEWFNQSKGLGGNPNSHTPAHESSAAVASFRTWPSSQSIIAKGPKGSP